MAHANDCNSPSGWSWVLHLGDSPPWRPSNHSKLTASWALITHDSPFEECGTQMADHHPSDHP